MPSTKEHKQEQKTEHTTHILNFFYDKDDGSALTALINDVRFHVIVDVADLKKGKKKDMYNSYISKLNALKDAEQRDVDADQVRKKQSKNGSKNPKKREASEDDKDSAIDVPADTSSRKSSSSLSGQDSAQAAVDLHNFVLSFFANVTCESAPPDREPVVSTIAEWYGGPTYFYDLQLSSDASTLEPNLLESDSELEKRITDLVPRMAMPKYIRSYDLPWLSASDLTVSSEVASPAPAHPGIVQSTSSSSSSKQTQYFFKPVAPEQPEAVTREIKILHKLSSLDLDIKVPQLLGFVKPSSSTSSKTKEGEAMGFLLSPIPKSRPLTELLRADVPESKRKAWADKCEKYVSALHKHGIIWGDAKGDNFLVDSTDELWIIDFGGSYTEGWVDPEISETQEGDKMGLEKVVKALEDPEKNTLDMDGEGEGTAQTDISETAKESPLFTIETNKGEKRKRERREREMEESVEKRVKNEDKGSRNKTNVKHTGDEKQEDDEEINDERQDTEMKESDDQIEELSEKAKYANARTGYEPQAFKEPPRTWCLQAAAL